MYKDTGYNPGGGMLSPDGSIFYLNIPKNASTYFSNLLLANRWSHWNILDQPNNIKKTIAFIRDPVDRWISGFSTYAALHLFGHGYGSDHFIQDYNNLTERLIFDQIIFDDHTNFQLYYIQQIVKYNPTFFRLNDKSTLQINLFLGYDLNTNEEIINNTSESNYDTNQISKFLTKKINSSPDLRSKLICRYYDDYKFINSIEFYNDPR
jgi:hypothetical protein